MLFFLSLRCGAWYVNIGLLYGVVFPIGSVRCPHQPDRPIGKTARTEPIGKTTPYASPIFTCHVRVNNILLFLNDVANKNPRDVEAAWVVRERVLQIDAFQACGGRCCTSLRKNNILLTRTRNVNIWLLYGVGFPIGSVRCVACKYRASVRCCFSYRLGAVPAPNR